MILLTGQFLVYWVEYIWEPGGGFRIAYKGPLINNENLYDFSGLYDSQKW
jgi:hypothetical protein